MKKTRYLLIGAGVSAARAVESIRQIDSRGSIVLVGREPVLPYDRPPLSKELLRGEIHRKSIRCKPRRYYWRKRVRLLLGKSVESIDLAGSPRTARLSNGETITFEKCLIATGAEPKRLPVPGSDLEGVYLLRTLSDARRLASGAARALRMSKAVGGGRAVVVGAGFVGMETASSLSALGLAVTVIEQKDQVWPGFADRETAQRIARFLEAHGVPILLGETVKEIRPADGTKVAGTVVTSSGSAIPCSLVCVAVGVSPNVRIAEEAGLLVDDGVIVDANMQARYNGGEPAVGVFAAGDIARFPDPFFSRIRRVEHYGQAEYTGLLAGTNMAGLERSYDLLTYVWSDLFDMHIEFAGDPAPADRYLLRDIPAENRFVTLSLRKGRLVAFLAVNWPEADFGPLRFMIQQRVDLSGMERSLADPDEPLSALIH
ncbi:MAG TPA: FAD-dependent oxidoreductase [Spirochaetia bacterium]|nr:FAD-dependent oxidoreductase [Spirochaetia bacterium]